MLILKIAWRNIFRQKRRTFLTVLTMFGGFTLSAISIGWSDGTYNNIISMFTRNRLGHIQIHERDYLDKPSMHKNIPNYREIGTELMEMEDVEAWTPRFYAAGLTSVGEKSSGARVIGIDPALESKATNFQKKITKGNTLSDAAANQAVLGKGLAETLKAAPGDTVLIFSQAADGSLANDLYEIVGILESGNTADDRSSLYLHLQDAQNLFVLDTAVHEIAVIATGLDEVEDLAESIETTLNNPDLNVETWKEFARSFYVAMKADKQGAWISLFVIILIVATGVLNTVLMTVLERRREYGVLRAVGTQPFQVFKLVIYEVESMALVSIAAGVLISLIVNHLLSINGLPMPETYTYGGMEFSRFYSEVSLRGILIPAVTIAFTAFIVGIFPAYKASQVEPAKAMRL